MAAEFPFHARRTVTRSGIALLLALFTLLCAIYPVGLPSSQKLGPAFNPANESVTVRPEAKLPAARAVTEAPDPRGPLPVTPAVSPSMRAGAPAALAVAPPPPDLKRLPGLSPFAARGPPARA